MSKVLATRIIADIDRDVPSEFLCEACFNTAIAARGYTLGPDSRASSKREVRNGKGKVVAHAHTIGNPYQGCDSCNPDEI